jgi:F-type H+-transporting ATPase subunit delta
MSDEQKDFEAVRHLVRASRASSEGARPFAEALLNAAENANAIDQVLEELEEIRSDILVRHPRFREIFRSPIVSISEKDRVLTDTFEGRAHPVLLRFLRVLNSHGRLDLFEPVIDKLRLLSERRRNRRWVVVRSAVDLTREEKEQLEAKLAQMLGATPVVQYLRDPDLIGGFSVQIGDRVYDLSLKTRLRQLRSRLIRTQSQEFRRQLAATESDS